MKAGFFKGRKKRELNEEFSAIESHVREKIKSGQTLNLDGLTKTYLQENQSKISKDKLEKTIQYLVNYKFEYEEMNPDEINCIRTTVKEILKDINSEKAISSTQVIEKYYEKTKKQKNSIIDHQIHNLLANLYKAKNNAICRRKAINKNKFAYVYYSDPNKEVIINLNTEKKKRKKKKPPENQNYSKKEKTETFVSSEEKSSEVEYYKQDIQTFFLNIIKSASEGTEQYLTSLALKFSLSDIKKNQMTRDECEKLTQDFFTSRSNAKILSDEMKNRLMQFFKEGKPLLSIVQEIKPIKNTI